MAKKTIAGISCLALGRALSRTECGLAYSAVAIGAGKVADLQVGLRTVFDAVSAVNRVVPGAASKIAAKARSLGEIIMKGGRIPASKSSAMLKTIRGMKGDVDQLFARAAQACPGKK